MDLKDINTVNLIACHIQPHGAYELRVIINGENNLRIILASHQLLKDFNPFNDEALKMLCTNVLIKGD